MIFITCPLEIECPVAFMRASLVAQLVKNLPAIQETPIQFLGGEDPLEKGQTMYSSVLGLPPWVRS